MGSFRLVGGDADSLLFLTGLEFDSSVSFFLLTLDGLLSVTPFTSFRDFVLELCCDICLVLSGFFGDSKLEVPLSCVGSSSGKASNSDTSLFAARPLRGLGDDLVVEDDFSVERGLSGGEAFFCREFLRLSDMFNCFAEVFFSRLVSLSGEVFLDFFGADFSEELAGLPLFLTDVCSSGGLANPLSEVSEEDSSLSASFPFSFEVLLGLFEVLL